jgi:hypothetical protein
LSLDRPLDRHPRERLQVWPALWSAQVAKLVEDMTPPDFQAAMIPLDDFVKLMGRLGWFQFEDEIGRLREANILYLVVAKFCDVDLHPNTVPNEQMGLIFENLIRHFNELTNPLQDFPLHGGLAG